jgi:hypothetical protein
MWQVNLQQGSRKDLPPRQCGTRREVKKGVEGLVKNAFATWLLSEEIALINTTDGSQFSCRSAHCPSPSTLPFAIGGLLRLSLPV